MRPVKTIKNQMLKYLDINSGDKNLLEDALLPLLRIIENDESIRMQDMPNKYTKRKPDEEK